MKKFGWAFIGCGGIAHITALELVRTRDNTIVSAWNRTASKAESFVKKFGGTAYSTIEEAINAPGVEGVYIAVTADRHADIMKRDCNKTTLKWNLQWWAPPSSMRWKTEKSPLPLTRTTKTARSSTQNSAKRATG